MQARNEVFEVIHTDIDAHLTSEEERSEKELNGQAEFIYGEVLF